MFSVIIPIYNKEKYIRHAILSVLSQTFQQFELILINDGSTDNSFQVVNSFISELQNNNPDVINKIIILNQENKGVSSTRNNGVKSAKYDYLAFLDADDWWEENFLEKMKFLIDEYPDSGVYGTGYYKIKKQRKIKSEIGLPDNFSHGLIDYFSVYAKNFFYMPLWIGATVIKKEYFILENGFKTYLKWGEDFDFWIRMSLKYKIAFLNNHLSNYNHDVDFTGRAMDNQLHPAENDFLFHTSLYSEFEESNINLKILFDKFRTYSLFQYYLDKNRRNEALFELNKVNWEKQPLKVRLKYQLPVRIVILGEIIKVKMSKLKSWTLGF